MSYIINFGINDLRSCLWKKMNYTDLAFTDLTIIWSATNMLVEWEILLSLNSLTSVFSICSVIPVPIFSDSFCLAFEHIFVC